jgi:hypothetical protein
VHYEAPAGPAECQMTFARDFKTIGYASLLWHMSYVDWILAADLTSVYEYHKLELQILQSKAPGIWSLKMSSHALGVDIIRRLYPDARIIWTHRDPYKAAGSFMSMASQYPPIGLDGPDMDFIRTFCPHIMHEHLRRPMAEMDKQQADPFIHVFYADLVRDPMAVMRDVYTKLGDPLTPEAEARMKAWIAANPQGRFGKHSYSLEQFGVTKNDLTPRFEDYLARFPIEMEG